MVGDEYVREDVERPVAGREVVRIDAPPDAGLSNENESEPVPGPIPTPNSPDASSSEV